MNYKTAKVIKIGNYTFPVLVLVLSLLSATDLCMGGCSGLSDYRLFGMHFAIGGSLYALLLVASVYLTERVNKHHWTTDLLIATGIGAELWFISVQKFVAKTWCPICLTIAGVLAAFALVRGLRAWLLRDTNAHVGLSHGKWLILQARNTTVVVLAVAIGFFIALTSTGRKHVELSVSAKTLDNQSNTPVVVGHRNPLSAKNIWFGNLSSPVEVYFISDWYCSYCRQVESVVKSVLPELGARAKYTWIDLAIHRESMNIIPSALNILLNDRKNYIKARRVLYNLTSNVQQVSTEDAQKSLTAAGINAGEPNPAPIAELFVSMVAFARTAGISRTPAVVVVNSETGTRQVLAGVSEITKVKLLMAVEKANAGQ